MTVSFVDSCYFNSNNSGTADFTVANNVTGWLTPAQANCVDGQTYRYRASSSDQSQWETGLGTYYVANNTLVRNIIITSTNDITTDIMTNNDGSITLSTNSLSTTTNYSNTPFDATTPIGMAVGNGLAVVIANGFVWTSNDYINWSKNTNLSNTYTYNCVCFDSSNTFYISTSNTSTFYPYILSSTDANTWSATQLNSTLIGNTSLSGVSVLGIFALSNTIIMTSQGSTSSNTLVWISSNKGATWTSNTISANVSLNHIIGYNGNYAAFRSNERASASTKLFLFSNTLNISSVDITSTFVGAFGIFDAAYGSNNTIVIAGGKFTGATSADAILTSHDNGSTWTEYSANVSSAGTFGIRSVSWDGSKFVAGGYDTGSPGYSSSVDGVTWTSLNGWSYGVQGPILASSSYQKVSFSLNPKVALTFGAEDFTFGNLETHPTTISGYGITDNILTGYACNLYQDSGRLGGNANTTLVLGANSAGFPAYLTLYNSATANASYAKFIYNNTDNGGTAGTLNSYVSLLINQIRSGSPTNWRRYGPEFWVTEVTAGSGTSSSTQSAGGKTGYLNLFNTQSPNLPQFTFHVYLYSITEEIIIQNSDGYKVSYKNGVQQSGNFLISPSDGWCSVTIQQTVNPYLSYGYQPVLFNVYTQSANDQFLLACPALMGGITSVDDNVGIIPGYNSWSA